MLRFTLRTLIARKLRLVLSALAIVIGVGFLGGVLILTDAMGRGFDGIIEGQASDVEVAYPGASEFGSVEDNRTIPATVVSDIEELPEVGSAYPNLILQTIFVVGENGKVVNRPGPPGLGLNFTEARNLDGDPIIELIDGDLPIGAGQIALDRKTAESAGYAIGDEVSLVTPGDPPLLEAELVGLVEFSNGGTLGATITIFDPEFMQETFFDGQDVYSTISVSAADGISREELRSAVAGVLPDGIDARTGDEVAETNRANVENDLLRYVRTFMLVFAVIALVVSSFIVVNTFSILVAQRSRELALLRALGASRRQVVRSVLVEAIVIGVIGSTIGIGVGYVLALGLKAVLGIIGIELVGVTLSISASTVVWCYALGVLVTAVAAVLPALRASRVAPISALRDDVALPESTLRTRLFVGSSMVVLGVIASAVGFAQGDSTGLTLIGLGLLVVLIGVSLASALLSRPVIAVFGVAYRGLFGSIGQLATQNAARNPRRTAATSSALMIGVALVAMVSIFGRSASASTDAALETSLDADLVISNAFGLPFSTAIAEQAREVPGVDSVAQVQLAFPRVDGGQTFAAGIEPRTLEAAVDFDLVDGDLSRVGPGTVAVSKPRAEGKDLQVGESLTFAFQGAELDLEVVAIYEPEPALQADYLVSLSTVEEGGLERRDAFVYVVAAPSADVAQVAEDIDALTKDLPTVVAKSPDEFADEQRGQVEFVLGLIYLLLALSIVIAVLGVINTLGLSVIERTREIGLLRAVGLARSQLRRMVALESIVIGVYGALLGVVMGTAFGVSLVRALKDEGLTELSVPWGLLAGFVVAAGVIGLLAAVFPARRAARLKVLDAIATE